MKLWTLIENTGTNKALYTEHGLSFYLETAKHKLLFDMGQTDAFWENAEKLGIDLRQVDIAVLSHGHYDHGGGLETFLRRNSTAKVYISRSAFEPHYNGSEKYIGLKALPAFENRIIWTEDVFEIDEELILYSCNENEKHFEIESFGLNKVENGVLVSDDFRHEQYLLIREGKKRILLSGCSHKGILNIADWFAPDVLIGGFHFKSVPMTEDGMVFLENAAAQLKRYPTTYYTCHCTGAEQYGYLLERMGEQLQYLSTGTTLTI